MPSIYESLMAQGSMTKKAPEKKKSIYESMTGKPYVPAPVLAPKQQETAQLQADLETPVPRPVASQQSVLNHQLGGQTPVIPEARTLIPKTPPGSLPGMDKLFTAEEEPFRPPQTYPNAPSTGKLLAATAAAGGKKIAQTAANTGILVSDVFMGQLSAHPTIDMLMSMPKEKWDPELRARIGPLMPKQQTIQALGKTMIAPTDPAAKQAMQAEIDKWWDEKRSPQAKQYQDIRQTVGKSIAKNEQILEGATPGQKLVYGVGSELPRQVAQLGLAAATGGSVIPIGITVAADTMAELEDKGVPFDQRLMRSIATGVIEAGTERISVPQWLKYFKKAGGDELIQAGAKEVAKRATKGYVLGQWIKGAVGELGEELMADPAHNLADILILGEQKPVWTLQQTGETALQSGVLSLLLGALGLPANISAHKMAQRLLQQETVPTQGQLDALKDQMQEDIQAQGKAEGAGQQAYTGPERRTSDQPVEAERRVPNIGLYDRLRTGEITPEQFKTEMQKLAQPRAAEEVAGPEDTVQAEIRGVERKKEPIVPFPLQNIPVVRYQKEKGDATFSRERGGIWYGRVNDVHGEDTGYNKGGITGGVEAVRETYTPKNPLVVTDSDSAGAGQAAIRSLRGEEFLNHVYELAGQGNQAGLKQLLQDVGVSPQDAEAVLAHPDRPQVVIDRIATEFARKAGHDSIIHTTPNGLYAEVVKLDSSSPSPVEPPAPIKPAPAAGPVGVSTPGEGQHPPRPLVNPHASALKQDEQLRKQQTWDRKYGKPQPAPRAGAEAATEPQKSPVHADIRAKLEGKRPSNVSEKSWGKYADKVAQLWEARAETEARLRGISVEEWYQGANRPEVAGAGTKAKAIGGTEYNQPAYHASMADFEHLDTSKVGTGLGGRLRGWGIYLSSKREMAEHYREIMAARAEQESRSVAAWKGEAPPEAKKGHLYKTEIPEDADLLDWDKPISGQSVKVRRWLTEAEKVLPEGFIKQDMTGEQLYWALAEHLDGDKEASISLRNSGIPGTRYHTKLMGGTTNYVIYDDTQTKVTRLYQGANPQTETEAFKKWFGESKIVDEQGRPMAVYHGTPTGGFTAFDESKKGVRDSGWAGRAFYFTKQESQADRFTATRSRDRQIGKKQIYAVYLSAQKPLIVPEMTATDVMNLLNASRKANGKQPFIAQEWGSMLREYINTSFFEGQERQNWEQLDPDERLIVLKDLGDPSRMAETAGYDGIITGDMEDSIAVFSPNQIKSATGNVGIFDPNNPNILMQSDARASVTISQTSSVIALMDKADESSLIHESAHIWLADMHGYVRSGKAGEAYMQHWKPAALWLGIKEGQAELTTEQHEKFARGFEQYMREGKAPSSALRQMFEDFKRWLSEIYKTADALNADINDDVRGFMDRMLTAEAKPAQEAGSVVVGKKKQPWEMTFADYRAERGIGHPELARTDLVGIERKTVVQKRQTMAAVDQVAKAYHQARTVHRGAVAQALAEGKPVPAEVLADYPDLKPAPKPKPLVPLRPPVKKLEKKAGAALGIIHPAMTDTGPTEALKAAGKKVAQVADEIARTFTPTTRGELAREISGNIRERNAEMARKQETADTAMRGLEKAMERLPEAEQNRLIDAFEQGKPTGDLNLDKASGVLRKAYQDREAHLKRLGLVNHFLDDYFAHYWKPKAGKGSKIPPQSVMGGKRPLAGPESFRKRRVFKTTAEGIAAGYEPVTHNPVTLTLIKLREMDRSIMAHDIMNEGKDQGYIKFFRGTKPEGWEWINDKIATVYGPRQITVKPGSKSILAGKVEAPSATIKIPGQQIMGRYAAPKEVARVLNNFLSPGLAGRYAAYDIPRFLTNALNQAQLGLSAFHLMTTSVNSCVSSISLGLRQLTIGQFGGGVKNIVKGIVVPASLAGDIGKGIKLRQAYLHGTTDPVLSQMVDSLVTGGGRVKMDSWYRTSAIEGMFSALRKAGQATVEGKSGTAMIKGGQAAIKAPFALLEAASYPVMEQAVPLMKLGAFYNMAESEIARLGPKATQQEQRRALGEAWDSVDNRFGQLIYDNLMWNKALKDILMLSMRSLGWNLGTIRELGGGLLDVPKQTIKAATGNLKEQPWMSQRMAYTIALPIFVGTMGAILTYLFTGKPPKEPKDYFFPPTGKTRPDGSEDRVAIASYMKDVYSYGTHPFATITNKINPLIGTIVDIWQNEDFYGTKVRNEDDLRVQQMKDVATYIGKQFIPFSIRGAQKEAEYGGSKGAQVGAFLGITAAPASVTRTKAQNMMNDFIAAKIPSGGRTTEEAERSRTKSDLLMQMRKTKGGNALDVAKAIKTGKITLSQGKDVLQDWRSDPRVLSYKRLTSTEAIKVYEVGTAEEKILWGAVLMDKLGRALKGGNLTQEELQAIVDFLERNREKK